MAEHGTTVMRVCRGMLGAADADDAWAETFLSALKAYPDLRPDSNIRGWLVTIAHRKAIDQIRSRERRPLPVGELPETPSTLGVPASPDTELWAALEALPLKQRGAVVYHHLAGLPYSEVARVVGIQRGRRTAERRRWHRQSPQALLRRERQHDERRHRTATSR